MSEELRLYKQTYQKEEERYVQQILVENPVIVERRGLTTNTTSGSEEPLSREEQLRCQRAESCRRSRINNKINKKRNATFSTPMLVENPITVERSRKVHNTTLGSEEPLSREKQLRRQHAESCGQSYNNNKIYKAKIKYHNKCTSEKSEKNCTNIEALPERH
ncbi:protein sisterless A-like [Teleopsis dalmanni]|uniref:protein sisterless A-like n=1 Tax=Teleopsis dalmanni TaxID=139649 RepID=UPI0018CCCA3D|nr:protein sisterless A-like [Teleopsis dalmanni]